MDLSVQYISEYIVFRPTIGKIYLGTLFLMMMCLQLKYSICLNYMVLLKEVGREGVREGGQEKISQKRKYRRKVRCGGEDDLAGSLSG